MSTRDEIRPIQPTRGRAVQGIKSRLDGALNRPQCLVFGLPPKRPEFSDTELTIVWDARQYAWQYRMGNQAKPLSIHTHCASGRHAFSRVSIALDALPIYWSRSYGVAESFEDTAARGVDTVAVELQIDIKQGGVQLAQIKTGHDPDWTPTNYKSESHLLRTLGLAHYGLNAIGSYGLGDNLAYCEGTDHRQRALGDKLLKMRHEVELPAYDAALPLEVQVQAVIAGSPHPLPGGGGALIWGPSGAEIDQCTLVATALSVWGHP